MTKEEIVKEIKDNLHAYELWLDPAYTSEYSIIKAKIETLEWVLDLLKA